jgi:SAM-dependent methyltransferase
MEASGLEQKGSGARQMKSLYTTRDTCRLCRSKRMWKAVALQPLPVASPNVKGGGTIVETGPADLWQCSECGFLQLASLINPEFQYRNFQYFTGLSAGLREHFGELIGELAKAGEIGPGKQVLDIGSNDGSLLRLVLPYGAKVLGIDPAQQIADAATASGIPTLAEFFNRDTAAAIGTRHGKMDVVISNNTVANLDDMHDFFGGIESLLALGGLVIIETQYGLDMMQRFLLDVIYHEHVSYFAVQPTARFLPSSGFELVDAKRIAPKGGSIRFYIQRKGGPRRISQNVAALIAEETTSGLYGSEMFAQFNARIVRTGEELRQRLAASRLRTGRALVYGASVGCAALVQYFRLGSSIDAVFDDTPLTNLMRTDAGPVPVLTGKQLSNESPTEVVVLAWRYAEAIARGQAEFVKAGGSFARALPEVSTVT